ncbi:Cos111p PWA37_002257 [Arxiozyma heterogenica]|uniref:Cos111p n=1 Tax=Arxiozyma heterogenica TaxID=278026 RepID=UPI002F1FF7F7
MARSEVQNINIVSNNYSRYGTSIYQKLYDTQSSKKNGSTKTGSYLIPSYNRNNASTSHIAANNRIVADNESLLTIGSTKSRIKRKYKSLISSGSKKLINKIYDHGSSDTFSIFSSKSHKEKEIFNLNNNDIYLYSTFSESFATIDDLPLEILSRIISYIDYDKHYKALVCCLYVSKRWYKATKIVLYKQPRFVSTYRVAQFVTSLRLHPENGYFVKVLKLSDLQNGLIFKEDDNEDEEEVVGNINDSNNESGDGNDDQNNVEGDNNGTALNEAGRNNNNNNNSINNTNNSEPFSDIAYAGWRDWRYRNDPLYSSPVLNSYTVKRIVSRSSSIHSNSSLFTSLSNGSVISMNTSASTRNEPSGSHIDTSQNTANRARSNSSVSSITSSIMSTFQNASHLSLTSSPLLNNTTGDYNKGEGNSLNNNMNITQKVNTITSQDVNNKWFRFKVMSKNKRRARNLTKYSTINSSKQQNYLCNNKGSSNTTISKSVQTTEVNKVDCTNNSDITGTSSQIRFAIEQPFKTNHPYTNKFLLKYASCKDLPLGYILHILNHCPNLVELDLSHLTICDDFKIVNKSKHHKRLTSLILPSVEESTIMTNSEENRLEVIYATDSSKNYEHNKNIIVSTGNSKSRRNSRIGQGVILTNNVTDSGLSRPLSIISCNSVSSVSNNDTTGSNSDHWCSRLISNRSEHPMPIDSQTKARVIEKSRRNSNKNSGDDVELYKLNPVEIFEILCTKLMQVTTIKMDGAVWCRQYMIKYFILIIFQRIIDYDIHTTSRAYSINMNNNNKIIDLSFLKAGMNRNFPWSCKGTLSDFVVLLVLDELLKNDDLTIEDLFNIKSERLYQNDNFITDSDVMEISNIFPIKFGLDEENQNIINFRIVILKNKRQTSYILKKVSNDYISLIINLCINENYNFMVSSTDLGILPKETPKRIDRLIHGLVARIKYLRNNDLRRHVGENNYISNTINII